MTDASEFLNPGAFQFVNALLFSQDSIDQLSSEDFGLETPERITLKRKGCYIILFYIQNEESIGLAQVFGLASSQLPNTPRFGAVNLLVEKEVARAFNEVRESPDHPLEWAGTRGYPFILVYRNGYPVAFYNGARSVQALIDYALTLACSPAYREPRSVAYGVQSSNSASIPAYRPYLQTPTTESNQVPEGGVRGYPLQSPTSPTTPEQISGTSGPEQATPSPSQQQTTPTQQAQPIATPIGQ